MTALEFERRQHEPVAARYHIIAFVAEVELGCPVFEHEAYAVVIAVDDGEALGFAIVKVFFERRFRGIADYKRVRRDRLKSRAFACGGNFEADSGQF